MPARENGKVRGMSGRAGDLTGPGYKVLLAALVNPASSLKGQYELVHGDTAVDPGLGLNMDGFYDLFFAATDQQLIVAVLEVGEIEDAFEGCFAEGAVIQYFVAAFDSEQDGVFGGVHDGNAKFHALAGELLNAHLQLGSRDRVECAGDLAERHFMMIVLAGGGGSS